MKLTIRELHDMLDTLDESGLLDTIDGEVTVAYQPHYPLAAGATGCGFIVKDGQVELVIGCGLDGGMYANSLQVMAFDSRGYELVHEDGDEEEW